MTRQSIIEKTIQAINLLPEDKAIAISDFADFTINQYEEQLLTKGLANFATTSKAFEFLHDEEVLYTEADIKQPYHG